MSLLATIPLESFSCDRYELCCPFCGALPTRAPFQVVQHPWAGQFKCHLTNCLQQPLYYVCSLCVRNVHPNGKPIRNLLGLRSHKRNQLHKACSLVIDPAIRNPSLPNAESESSVIPPSLITVSNFLTAQSSQCAPPFDFAAHFPVDNFGNASNCQYFERQHGRMLGGASGIVASACYMDQEGTIDLHPANTLYAYMVALLSKHIPGSLRGAFAAVLHHSSRSEIDPPVPSTPNVLKSQFFSGTRSVLQNIPRPKISILENNHIYVSLFDSIRDLFGHGGDVESLFLGSPSVHSNTPRGLELIRNAQLARQRASPSLPVSMPLFILPIYLWRDGFDPNNTKKNRGSVWACIASLGTPQSKIHSSCNTYLIGLGPHNLKHVEIEALLLKDLTLLDGVNYFYSSKIKKMVAVYAQLYSIQEDRPEKADHTYTVGGGSTNHSCFGYAVNLAEIWDDFTSCPSCHLRRVKGETPVLCEGCFDWNLDKARYPLPLDDFPPEQLPSSDGMLPAQKVTFASLSTACNSSHHHLVANTWSNANATAYLRSFGVQPAIITAICAHAKVCAAYKNAESTDRLLAFQQRHPNFTPHHNYPLPTPFPWQYPHTGMADWVETIMHHLFLGITLAISKDFVFGWLRAHQKFPSFQKSVDPIIAKVKALSLDWCRALPLGDNGSFGPHVSENYLAHARLFRWIHSPIRLARPTEKEYCDPVGKEVPQYNKTECRAWLTNRRICFLKSSPLDFLRRTIMEVVAEAGGSTPPILPPVLKAAPIEALESILISFIPMVSRIMVRGVISEQQSDDALRSIKIFLTTVDDFAKHGRLPTTAGSNTETKLPKPYILSKYNFITLLKIPSCMLRFGSLRLLWEGDGKGEGALPLLKRSVTSLNGNWAFNVAVNYYQKRGISRVLQTIVPVVSSLDDASEFSSIIDVAKSIISAHSDSHEEIDAESDSNGIPSSTDGRKSVRYKAYKTYDSYLSVSEMLLMGDPISVVSLDHGNEFFVVLKDKERNQVVKIRPGNLSGFFCDMAYFEWRIDPISISITTFGNGLSKLESRISCKALLLPLIQWRKHTFDGDMPATAPFGLITDDWEEMFADGSIQKPKFTQPLTPPTNVEMVE